MPQQTFRTIYKRRYTVDRGVDLLNSPFEVSTHRSPLCLNMIKGRDGTVKKRVGWRVMQHFDGAIHTMAFGRLQRNWGNITGETEQYLRFMDVILVHAGRKLYAVTNAPILRQVMGEDAPLPFATTDYHGTAISAQAAWILRYLAGLEPNAQDWQIANADEDGDGLVTEHDASYLLKYLVGLINSGGLNSREIAQNIEDAPSTIFFHNGAAYLMDGKRYIQITFGTEPNSYTCRDVAEIAYIPTTSLSGYYAYPDVEAGTEPDFTAEDGTWTDGELHEEENLLTLRRINTLAADGLNSVYWLDHPRASVEKVELYRNVGGVCTWTPLESTAYTVSEDNDKCRSKLTFTDTPPAHPQATGLANIRVTFSILKVGTAVVENASIRSYNAADVLSIVNLRLIPKNAQEGDSGRVLNETEYSMAEGKLCLNASVALRSGDVISWDYVPKPVIELCNIAVKYGYYNDNRFFVSGSPAICNRDWCSGIDDPTYFPVHGWTDIGSSSAPIRAYVPFGEALGILKADDKAEAGVFVRAALATEDGSIIFPVQQGNPGIGASSMHGSSNFLEDAVFVAKEGVYAIRLQDISKTTALTLRSEFVNRIIKQADTARVVCAVWDNLFVLVMGDKCLVADGNQRTGDLDSRYYQYDWYIWDNVPATALMELDGELWFGTADGRLCKFNSDIDDDTKYSDGAVKVNEQWVNGEPIKALWATKVDDFDNPSLYKRLDYNAIMLLCDRSARSSAVIKLVHNGQVLAAEKVYLDAIQSTEGTTIAPTTVRLNPARLAHFENMQVIFENNELNEGFGVIATEVRYTLGNNA